MESHIEDTIYRIILLKNDTDFELLVFTHKCQKPCDSPLGLDRKR